MSISLRSFNVAQLHVPFSDDSGAETVVSRQVRSNTFFSLLCSPTFALASRNTQCPIENIVIFYPLYFRTLIGSR